MSTTFDKITKEDYEKVKARRDRWKEKTDTFAEMYGSNPCSEIHIGEAAPVNLKHINGEWVAVHERERLMEKHFGGVSYNEAIELMKQHFPENFI